MSKPPLPLAKAIQENSSDAFSFCDLQNEMNIKFNIKGKGLKSYYIPEGILKKMPPYQHIENFSEKNDKELALNLDQEFEEETVDLFLKFLFDQYVDDASKKNKKEMKDVVDNHLILDEFLTLADQNCVDHESLYKFVKKVIVKSCLNDQSGNHVIKHFKLAFQTNYSFIKEVWKEIIDEIASQDLYLHHQNQFCKMYDSICSYIKNELHDPDEVELIQYTLLHLFPKKMDTSSAINFELKDMMSLISNRCKYAFIDNVSITEKETKKLAEQMCEAWFRLRQPRLPKFPGKKTLKEILAKCAKCLSPYEKIIQLFLFDKSMGDKTASVLGKICNKYPTIPAAWFHLGIYYINNYFEIIAQIQLDESEQYQDEVGENEGKKQIYFDNAKECFKETLKLDSDYESSIIEVILKIDSFIVIKEEKDISNLLKEIFECDKLKNFKALIYLAKCKWAEKNSMKLF